MGGTIPTYDADHGRQGGPLGGHIFSAESLQRERIAVAHRASDEADSILVAAPDTVARIERVIRLSEGFESVYGMDLLSSVHWVATHENPDAATDPAIAAPPLPRKPDDD